MLPARTAHPQQQPQSHSGSSSSSSGTTAAAPWQQHTARRRSSRGPLARQHAPNELHGARLSLLCCRLKAAPTGGFACPWRWQQLAWLATQQKGRQRRWGKAGQQLCVTRQVRCAPKPWGDVRRRASRRIKHIQNIDLNSINSIARGLLLTRPLLRMLPRPSSPRRTAGLWSWRLLPVHGHFMHCHVVIGVLRRATVALGSSSSSSVDWLRARLWAG